MGQQHQETPFGTSFAATHSDPPSHTSVRTTLFPPTQPNSRTTVLQLATQPFHTPMWRPLRLSPDTRTLSQMTRPKPKPSLPSGNGASPINMGLNTLHPGAPISVAGDSTLA